jgi:uncharacterized protein YceH (UPF0502 family)
MKIDLSPMEARVIGCLIEKQITTPEHYPLSLNALVNACNQKSNRDPMMDVAESQVQGTLDALSKKHMILERSGFGSRVPKYQHRFCNTEFGTLKFNPLELAIVTELLLRGPQTPGELRTRASRMAPVSDVSEIETALETLRTREDGPFVVRLAREPGRRDSRWAHLFSGPVLAGTEDTSAVAPPRAHSSASAQVHSSAPASAHSPEPVVLSASADASSQGRIERLEAEVKQLRAELDELKRSLGA